MKETKPYWYHNTAYSVEPCFNLVMVIRFGAMRHGISSQRKSSRTAEYARYSFHNCATMTVLIRQSRAQH